MKKLELKNYYTIKEIASIAKKSIRTVERKRDILIEEGYHKRWFRMKSKPFKYSHEFLSVLVSDEVYEHLTQRRQLVNLVDCLRSDRQFEKHLTTLDWDYFITITYEYPLSNDRCHSVISKLAETIDTFSFGNHYRMFFTSEPFTSIKGYHHHVILKVEDSKKEDIEALIERECPKGRVDVQPYDKYSAGIFYAAKKELQGEDWDIFGNNLTKDGIDAVNRTGLGRVA